MQPQPIYYPYQGYPQGSPTPGTAQFAGVPAYQYQSTDPDAAASSQGGPGAGGAQGVQQGMGAAGPASSAGQQTSAVPTYGPLVDIVETREAVEIFVDTPGFDEDDIQIDADEQSLHLVAEREADFDDDEAVPIHVERPPRIERTVGIPVRVELDDAAATYEDGVCRVTLPKTETTERAQTRIGFH